jgi:hypothetical protein
MAAALVIGNPALDAGTAELVNKLNNSFGSVVVVDPALAEPSRHAA